MSLLFADEIVLVSENPKMLQKMLDIVKRYSQKFRFRFNQDKSNVMIFGRRDKNQKFRLGESELQIVESYKYLGLVLDRKFSFKTHLGKILDKAKIFLTKFILCISISILWKSDLWHISISILSIPHGL